MQAPRIPVIAYPAGLHRTMAAVGLKAPQPRTNSMAEGMAASRGVSPLSFVERETSAR
jgi:hypothetical protein